MVKYKIILAKVNNITNITMKLFTWIYNTKLNSLLQTVEFEANRGLI